MKLIFRIMNLWSVRHLAGIHLFVMDRYIWRPFIKELKNHFGDKEISGIEIGVCLGFFSRQLLTRLNIGLLHLIDPYDRYEGYTDDLNHLNLSWAKVQAEKRLRKFSNKGFIQLPSEFVAHQFVDESLEFVYIDGNHAYEYVKKDLKLYWPKVKKGGILGGHDMNAAFLGVCRAVVEFANKEKLILYGEQNEWWVYKE